MPVNSVAVSLEGIIQKNVSLAPIHLGIALYHSLAANFNVLLYTESSRKSADYWLSLEALNKHAAIEYNEELRKFSSSVSRKIHQVKSLQRRGYHVDLVIEPDPEVSAALLEEGFSVLTFTHAQFALPQWRPDYEEEPRPWHKLAEMNHELALLRSLDKRMEELDEVSYD